MKILCLYNNPSALKIFDWMREQGHETILKNDRLEVDWADFGNIICFPKTT